MIDTIIFDQGNVLVDFDPEEILGRYGYFGPFLKKLKKAVFDTPLWPELDLGERSNKEIIGDMKRNAPDMAEEIDRFFDQLDILCWPYPYAKPLIRDIHDRGYAVYILSNYNAEFFGRDKAGFAFLDYCDGVVISGEEKLVKPDRRIYDCLIRRYGLEPERCAFVDDSADNCETAESMGMKPVFVQSQADILLGLFQLTGKHFLGEEIR